jgi:hypothetical protein
VTQTTAVPSLSSARPRRSPTLSEGGPVLRIVPWVDPVADPHGLHPCSRYVELYWLGVIGPSTTRRGPVELSRVLLYRASCGLHQDQPRSGPGQGVGREPRRRL